MKTLTAFVTAVAVLGFGSIAFACPSHKEGHVSAQVDKPIVLPPSDGETS